MKKQPRELSVVLAARAALRVLPFVQEGLRYKPNDILLPVFRALAFAWVAARYSYPENGYAAPPIDVGQFGRASSVATSAADAAQAVRATVSNPSLAAGVFNFASDAVRDFAREASATAISKIRDPLPDKFGGYRLGVAMPPADTREFYEWDKRRLREEQSTAAFYAQFDPTFWSAVSSDATLMQQGRTAPDISGSQLWADDHRPDPLRWLWQEMQAALLAAKQDWEVWINWYDDRLAGRVRDEERELAYVRIDDALWMQGPAIVNAEIKRRIEELEQPTPIPPEPSPELGPVLQVTERGLEIISQPYEGDFDAVQKVLHDRLRRLLPALTDATHRVANAHPALDHIVSEYSDLIARPLDQLDAASLWAVGTGLLAFRAAFTNLASGSMTEPLEPGHLALLQQAAELHGGFILGFPKGRELTDRADHARLSPEIIAQIEPPARQILESLARESTFVETRTRKFFAAVDESLVVHGWKTARTGHAAYVVTRNSLIALGKILIRANSVLATVAGGIVLNCVDPGLQMTQHIIRFMLENAQTVASFAEPFPELRNWLCFLIDHIDREK